MDLHRLRLLFLVTLLPVAAARADDEAGKDGKDRAGNVAPGHSLHGEAFTEGPRRRLPPFAGCGIVHFPVTTAVPEAQAFFDQGVGQLHGFAYWEAERSFRTVLALDPECVMAHWGMAMANLQNESRARQVIALATGPALEKATPREKAWIEATRKLFAEHTNDDARKAAATEYIGALEKIALDHPDDLEARAFLVGFSWWFKSRGGVPIPSLLAIDALADAVLTRNPRHPIHHYVIHLWDHQRAARAVRSAAACGPAAPGIAHMWHMPGHVYSELERWGDAAWQQEAAARVDHAHMLRAHLYPDQIHNFAHNSEWLVRNLNHVGRVRDALAISANMVAMPRVPRSKGLKPEAEQRFDEEGSCWQYGRNRLFETILDWEAWSVAAALADTPYLEPGREFDDQWRREHLLALAACGRGDTAAGAAALARLEALETGLRNERTAAADRAEAEAREKKKNAAEISKAMVEAMQPFTEKVEKLRAPLAEVRLRAHLAAGRIDDAKGLLTAVADIDKGRLALVHQALGDPAKGLEVARALAEREKQRLLPAALVTWLEWESGKKEEAVKSFAEVRRLAGVADTDLPVLKRLAPVAEAAGCSGDWRSPASPATDLGERPDLATLGPRDWHAWQAGDWVATAADGTPVSGASFRGRPHVVVLTLGEACVHCNKQLEAFAAQADAFAKAGFPVVVVSTDRPAEIAAAQPAGSTAAQPAGDKPAQPAGDKPAQPAGDKPAQPAGAVAAAPPHPFPVHSGADGAAFRALDAWDDFESRPLHATCFIAADGRMRWQHVGHEPFMLPGFLLEEVKRLESLPEPPPFPPAGP
jgi:hypothetical protein